MKVYVDKEIISRAHHACDWCGEDISKGRCWVNVATLKGRERRVWFHVVCRKAVDRDSYFPDIKWVYLQWEMPRGMTLSEEYDNQQEVAIIDAKEKS